MRSTIMYGTGDVRIENVPDTEGIRLAPTWFMSHIAMLEVDDEGDHVSDEEYAAAPAIDDSVTAPEHKKQIERRS